MQTEQKAQAKIYAYLRVSTTAQDVENQRHGIIAHAAEWNRAIDDTISDTASSRIPWRDRAIGPLIADAPPGSLILVAEISRLARNTLEVLEIAASAAERGHTIIATKNRLTITGSIESRIMLVMLSLAAEIERDFIQSRTREALARAKANGKTLGRPVGATGKSKLDESQADIAKWLQLGLNKTSIAKLLNCSRTTLNAWMERQAKQRASAQQRDLLEQVK